MGLSHGRIVVAPDSFKGSLSSLEAAHALIRGMQEELPDVRFEAVPMADGGEGTVQALVAATGGQLREAVVTGPLGEPVRAVYGLLGDGQTAVIEMAAASGLPLVPPERRNPLVTTSAGTGELVRAALDAGCRRLILGIGGSATNDGGAGMMMALGAKLLDEAGQPIPPGAAGLEKLAKIDASGMDPRLGETQILVACDVDNPLCGPQGASAVFGPQKGATPDMIPRLDRALARYGQLLARDLGKDVAHRPGAGAAGGMGAGVMAFLEATLRPGVEIVIDVVGLQEKLRAADLVITGEGRLDAQTARGKAPAGVARVASRLGVPVLAVAGAIEPGADRLLRGQGFAALIPIVDGPMTLEAAMERTRELLEATGRRIGALLRLGAGWPLRRRCGAPESDAV